MAARIWKSLRRKPKTETAREDGPELPFELAYLWDYFAELSGGIAIGGFGPAVVTWDNIGWWSQLMRVPLEPWEVRMLVQLSVIRANVLAAAEKVKNPAGKIR